MTSRGERESEARARSREDNEWTARVSAGRMPMTSFRCECGDAKCMCAISLTHAEYEHVRDFATHFAIARNHENPESEQLIEEHGRFDVVESIDHDAVMVARKGNPRQGWQSELDRARSGAAVSIAVPVPVPVPVLNRGSRRAVPIHGYGPT